MLGSTSEAEDAVQETWLRLSRSGADDVDNLGGWLTTVVARVCLDMLRSRKSRREEQFDPDLPDTIASHEDGVDPEREALLADSVGPALLVVLETLAPAERVAFVLHDVFAVPFDEIAPVVGRSSAAARQLASRARRRVRGEAAMPDADVSRQRKIVDAFLAAARDGDFDGLLAVLDPDVVLRADDVAAQMGTRSHFLKAKEIRGALAVAGTFSGQARDARRALVNGIAGLAWAPGGTLRVVFGFTTAGDKILSVELIASPDRIRELDVVLLDD
jgi:RNA polymerase sigma-70 factor (ECF subfamily)